VARRVDKPDCPLTCGRCAYSGMLWFLAVRAIFASSFASLAGLNVHVFGLCRVCTLLGVVLLQLAMQKPNFAGVGTLAAESRGLHKAA